VIISEEVSVIGREAGLGNEWMNFTGDSVIGQIGDGVELSDNEE